MVFKQPNPDYRSFHCSLMATCVKTPQLVLFVVLQTNDALVAPLLRLKENNCHVEECERVLMKNKKYNELVILYQTKGLHKKGVISIHFLLMLLVDCQVDRC